ncbi:MAG: hypothetical protein QM599_10590 [Pseudoxanthomonas sp.]
MNPSPAVSPVAIAFFICAAAFIAVGVSRKAFLGVGFAFPGLAFAFSRQGKRS